MKLKEIASGIRAHLKRMENDPEINKIIDHGGMRLKTYYFAGATAAGSKVMVSYVGYQGATGLSKGQAAKYLEWLNSGKSGTHHEAGVSK